MTRVRSVRSSRLFGSNTTHWVCLMIVSSIMSSSRRTLTYRHSGSLLSVRGPGDADASARIGSDHVYAVVVEVAVGEVVD